MGIFARLFGTKKERVRTKTVIVKATGALDSASTSQETAAYWSFASSASADEIANAEARKVLRARCRYECLNDPYAANAARNMAISVIGTGPSLQLHGINRETAEPIEKRFRYWAKHARMNEKLELAVRSLVFDGEIFFRFVTDDRITEGFNVELIDAGRVTSETFGDATDENELDGIRYDQHGNPTFYTVARHVANPMYSGLPIELERVPADEILHLFIPDLPGQHRGLPLLQSSLQTLARLKRYNDAVLEAAETAACYSVLIETENIPDGEEEGEEEGEEDETVAVSAGDSFRVPRGSATFLPRGSKSSQMKPEQPTANHGEFMSTTLTGIGAGVGQPRNIISNDSSDYNYASGRLDHQTFFRYVETIQQRLTYILDAIFDYWAEQDDDLDPAFIATIETEWYFAEMQHVDPLKEAEAAIKLVFAGLMTKKEYFAKYGQDVEQQVIQMRKEAELFGPLLKLPPTEGEEIDLSAMQKTTKFSELQNRRNAKIR
ncbi:MAG: phage portal protein [Planctomycetaceae bacterium]|nr:phage portal protein [Planctomycetaceae bacterium]